VLSSHPRHAHIAGFDLHANVAVPAADRGRLEQLCRYLLRPPVAQDRLRRLDEDHILLTLKTAWADGTRHLLFAPLELVEKLAALTPRPRINLILYHGVLAPHARWRPRVVASGLSAEAPHTPTLPDDAPTCAAPSTKPRHWAWANLMRRAFDIDVRANLSTLMLLRDFGLDPTSERARNAVDLVRDRVTWGPEFGNLPFFEGEVEPCINGRVVTLGAYFGEASDRLVDRLLGEQLSDGGWNCEAERGSIRSSFHTTICVLEGLLEHEKAKGATAAATDARGRAQEYLLARRMFRRLSSGEVIDLTWTRFTFPTLWQYDVLRGLHYLRDAGVAPDERVAEAVGLVAERRQPDGRWLLDARPRDAVRDDLEGGASQPNRWNTLRVVRVVDWYEGGRAHV
jgi:hypothetical protein